MIDKEDFCTPFYMRQGVAHWPLPVLGVYLSLIVDHSNVKSKSENQLNYFNISMTLAEKWHIHHAYVQKFPFGVEGTIGSSHG